MKFEELPQTVQEVASKLLSERLSVLQDVESRTEQAKKIAETIRDTFIVLYS